VAAAIDLADTGGSAAMTIRALAQSLQLTTMSVYTHVNTRADLLVLMVDQVHARMPVGPSDEAAGWRVRVRRVAEENLALYRAHPWMVDSEDPRVAVGPGTIAKYDRELQAFEGTGLSDVERDAALSFVRDFVRAAASRLRESAEREHFGPFWAEAEPRLSTYLGDRYPLAQSVGRAAGETMDGPYDADVAWKFGLDRVIDGLAGIISEASAR
jgi:AcrR family transcriptional regulator